MTVSMLRNHIVIAFHALPKGSYLHLDQQYEIDSIDRKDVHMHNVSSGEPICQSVCSLRNTHFHLS